VSRSIIQTAVTNRDLHLELSYRVPCILRKVDASVGDTTIETELALCYDDPQTSGEFSCLLSVI